eukprot:gnl/TRDRNA2_/TRDRNA2_129691_c1_seq1.p1 gnl/TRDRNA2_/TRDRNA2_129691_c1~~gnl/TRDRNA2_/TRDRNA2_129691_c1_seq1.p1  ORF type:complete len:205 (-),score=31.07 gnl/TRDRNA2_/TRDRNA2_129691_c1_seq1:30-644(-)
MPRGDFEILAEDGSDEDDVDEPPPRRPLPDDERIATSFEEVWLEPADGRVIEKAPEHILSDDEAVCMVDRLMRGYLRPEFQHCLVQMFKRYAMDFDEVGLVKSKQALFLTVQAEVIPDFGFEGNSIGAHKSFIQCRGRPCLAAKHDMQMLCAIYFLPVLAAEEELKAEHGEGFLANCKHWPPQGLGSGVEHLPPDWRSAFRPQT